MSQTHHHYEEELLLLANKALTDINTLTHPIIQFCGPISTGGFGTTEENLESLNSIINFAEQRKLSVFNQISYERRLDAILKKHKGYDYPILDYFYRPILSSKIIDALIFLPLWKTSVGSSWEHEYAKSLDIPIYYLENMVLGEIEKIYSQLKKT